mmetsp:Transcript_42359/g.90456  ORF Transcript_42359/g.90456 Transcript_42359/m.90456 type:complete len:362 (-) Transcript_42359:20-1105(-)
MSSPKKNSSMFSPHLALSSSPASVPSFTASSMAPARLVSKTTEPSGLDTSPWKRSCPSTSRACPAIGVRQLPSRAARKARSQSTATLVSGWLSASRYLKIFSSPSRHWMPIAPWATAGSISSNSRTRVMCSVMSIRLRPACASMVASTTFSCSFFKRVCTLPRKLTHLRPGFFASSCAWRRSEAVPMTEPAGSSLGRAPLAEIHASRVSSRSRLQGRIVPGTSHVGTSFIEWTHTSTSPLRSATSSSLVKRPLPPSSFSALSRTMSPVVLITLISTAESSASSSGKAAASRRFVSYACASASGEPRVPSLTIGSPALISTAPRLVDGAASRLVAGAKAALAPLIIKDVMKNMPVELVRGVG